jgi:glutamate dehydrogenase (NAD(P)+)
MDEIFRFGGEMGPGKVLHIYVPKLGLQSGAAVDNTASGPSIGGVRFAPDVTAGEACRLARAMTLKNAAAGLPHGGGKAVIASDPKMDPRRKEQ